MGKIKYISERIYEVFRVDGLKNNSQVSETLTVAVQPELDGAAISPTNPLPIRSTSEIALYDGNSYLYTNSSPMGDGATAYYYIAVGTIQVLFNANLLNEGEFDFSLYETPTMIFEGLETALINRNRASTNTSSVTFKINATPNGAALGDLLIDNTIYAGFNSTGLGGEDDSGMLLKASTNYLLRIQNSSGYLISRSLLLRINE